MSTIVLSDQVRIPAWVVDQDSFRRWAFSADFPQHGWFSHLAGELWVDLSMETFAHNKIKAMIGAMLTLMVENNNLGHFFVDRMLLTNLDAFLSTEPDCMFVSQDSLDSKAAEFEEGNGTLEVLGTPDMVLEVISKTSVKKDTEVLRDLYWQAGIAEYWLVDSRQESVELEILRKTVRGYVTTRKQSGWTKSAVFGKSFRLSGKKNAQGLSTYALDIR